MKIAFYEPYAFNIPHFERCLELIQVHLDKGDTPIYIGCDGNLSSCDINQYHYNAICSACVKRRKIGLNLLSEPIPYKNYRYLTETQEKAVDDFMNQAKFDSINSLMLLEYDNFDIGYAVASSLISLLRDPNPNINKYRSIFNNYLRDALSLYFSLLNHFKEEGVELVYLFNGRFAYMRAAIRAAELLGIDYYTHEVGSDIDKYLVFKNALPHSIAYAYQDMMEFWEAANPEKRTAIGASFYEDQQKGKVLSKIYHYTKNQQSGLFPENWDEHKENISIFNSSEDEFAAIGDEWKGGVYTSQYQGIQQIVAAFANKPDFHIYLRIHPNLGKASPRIVQELYNIQADNFTIIAPDSPISTYSLASNSHKVVTFSSSVGIEAAYLGTPAIVLGESFYKRVGSTYNPTTHEEVIKLLSDKQLPAKDKTGALIYGFWLKERGIPYKYYQAESLFEGKFKGTEIKVDGFTGFVSKLFQKIQYARKKFL